MATKTNKMCLCCGTSYSYCPSCPADKNKPAYLNAFCSWECNDLFKTATDYFAGVTTKEEGLKFLGAINTTGKKYNKGVQQFINEVKGITSTPIKNPEPLIPTNRTVDNKVKK